MEEKAKRKKKPSRLFVIVCRTKEDWPAVGERLRLRDAIERDDYHEIDSEVFDGDMLKDIKETIENHLEIRTGRRVYGECDPDLDHYHREFVVITSARYIVKAFFRI